MKPELVKHYPVAIIGGGPIGSIFSKLLSSYGVSHALFEKRSNPTAHPQAHYINARSNEIIQSHFQTIYKNMIKELPSSNNWR